jgi:hypothetical protein
MRPHEVLRTIEEAAGRAYIKKHEAVVLRQMMRNDASSRAPGGRDRAEDGRPPRGDGRAPARGRGTREGRVHAAYSKLSAAATRPDNMRPFLVSPVVRS